MTFLRMLHDDHDHGELTGARVGNVIGAAVAIAAVTLFGLKLPSLITKWGGTKASQKTRALVETLLTAFAAGSFWGLAIMHMLLEAITAFDKLEWGIKIGMAGGHDHDHHSVRLSPYHDDHDHDHEDEYSFFNPAYIFAVGGYLLMLAIQNGAVVLSNKNKLKKKDLDVDDSSSSSSENADAVISCIALTVHAIFEGIVVGLADSHSLVWVAAVAVMGHKWAESFALAQSMRTKACSNKLRLSLLVIFFLASPVGVICGLFISSFNGGVAVASITAVSAGVLVFVAGHCTEDVFGGHCHSVEEEASASAHLHHDEGSDHSSHMVADLESHPPHHRDAHTHGHGPSHCHDKSAGDFSASLGVFCGRMVLMTAGAGLVLGMMCLHMINPGHTH